MRNLIELPLVRLSAVLPLLLIASCDIRSGDPERVVVRDSAGIQLVENLDTPEEIPIFAVVEEEPFAELGVIGGNRDQEFGRIQTAAFLPPDRVLIADSQTRETSVFSTDGTLIRRFGGAGEGPGEFQYLSRVQVIGRDSVMVWDRRGQRITLFPIEDGEPLSFPMSGEVAARTSSVDLLADGTLLARVRPATGSLRQYSEATLVQDSTVLSLLTLTGELIAELGTFFSSERVLKVQIEGSIVRTSEVSPVFSRHAEWAISEDLILFGDNARVQVDAYDFNGRLRRRMRAPGLDLPLERDLVSEIMERRIEESGGSPEARRQIEELVEAYPLPETTPAFTELLVDDLGCLWAREYDQDWKEQAVWYVFEESGHLAGKVVLPAGATVYEIGEDYVLLRPQHELYLPMIRLHRLHRGWSG